MKKRIFGILLALCMVLSLVPVTAFAEYCADQHTFDGGYYRIEEEGHYKECDNCEYYDEESFDTHYDDDEDSACDACGFEMGAAEPEECEHTFEYGFYRAEENGHYKECDNCEYYDEESFEAHVDTLVDALCDRCWYGPLPHDHRYEGEWYYTTESGHYKDCDYCDYYDENSFEEHIDEDGDVQCDRCWYLMPHEHTYTDGYFEHDETMHYPDCDYCTYYDIDAGQPHTDEDGNDLCDTCEYFLGNYTLTVTDGTGKQLQMYDSVFHGDVLTAVYSDTVDYIWYFFVSDGTVDGESIILSETDTYTVNVEDFAGTDGILHVDVKHPVNNSDLASLAFAVNMESATVPLITQQPVDVTVSFGERFETSVAAEGEDLTYQWYVHNAGMAEGKFAASKIKSSTYSAVMNDARHDRQVYCVITDAYGNTVQSETVTIRGIPATELKILQQPTDVSAKFGEEFETTVVAEGDGLSYQWYVHNAGMAEGKFAASKIKSSTYSTVMNDARHDRQIYCIITDAGGNTVQTDTVTIKGVPSTELKILQQPTDVSAKLGERFETAVVAEGDGLSYQWYVHNAGMAEGKFAASKIKSSTYSTVMNDARHDRQIYCIITDAGGNSITTEIVTLTCTDLP